MNNTRMKWNQKVAAVSQTTATCIGMHFVGATLLCLKSRKK